MNMYHFAVGNGVQEPLLLVVASFLGSALTMMKIKKRRGVSLVYMIQGRSQLFWTGVAIVMTDKCMHT